MNAFIDTLEQDVNPRPAPYWSALRSGYAMKWLFDDPLLEKIWYRHLPAFMQAAKSASDSLQESSLVSWSGKLNSRLPTLSHYPPTEKGNNFGDIRSMRSASLQLFDKVMLGPCAITILDTFPLQLDIGIDRSKIPTHALPQELRQAFIQHAEDVRRLRPAPMGLRMGRTNFDILVNQQQPHVRSFAVSNVTLSGTKHHCAVEFHDDGTMVRRTWLWMEHSESRKFGWTSQVWLDHLESALTAAITLAYPGFDRPINLPQTSRKINKITKIGQQVLKVVMEEDKLNVVVGDGQESRQLVRNFLRNRTGPVKQVLVIMFLMLVGCVMDRGVRVSNLPEP